MKKIGKVIALALVLVMISVSSVNAAEIGKGDRIQNSRSVHFYSENNRHFTGTYNRYVSGAGYVSTYLDAAMSIAYYYEEGIYAENLNFFA